MTEASIADLPALTRKEARELGLKMYNPGKVCRRGHMSLQYTHTGCVRCANDRDEIRRHRHAVELSKSIPLKRKAREAKRKEYKNSPGVREKKRANNRLWVRNNKERRLEIARRATNTRRARKLSAIGSHTAEQIENLFSLQREKCANCKIRLNRRSRRLDHIEPLSRGGSNDIRNLQWLCSLCNCTKSAKSPLKWAAENGRLL